MRLSVSEEAKADLAALNDLGKKQYGERAAETYLEAIGRQIDRIAEWPLLARVRDDVAPDIRLMDAGAHNIFYRIETVRVQILRIMHHSADWMSEL